MILLKQFVKNGRGYGQYLCQCGNKFVSRKDAIKSGQTVSCGCYNAARITTHGLSKTPEYKAWQEMLQRCLNPVCTSYKNYGGRGITVCQQWRDFYCFILDMGKRPSPKHSLDRKMNDRGYYPDNCRWATRSQQQQNKRNTRFVEYDGKIVSLALLARLNGLNPILVWTRVFQNGWPVERAITEVPNHTR